MYKLALAAFSLIPVVLGQAYGAPPAPATTSSTSSTSAAASAATGNADASSGQVLVQVAADGFSYTPNNVNASIGTIVTFVFGSSIGHSVTQTSFANPCSPLEGGFSSGIVNAGNSFSVNVTTTDPISFMCIVPTHCGLGMVGTINAAASGTNSTSALVAAAQAIGGGESTVSATGLQTGGVGIAASAGPTTGTPSVSGASATSAGSGTSASASASTTPGAAVQHGASSTLGLLSVVAGLFAFAL
ncbi:uncharacterized protein PHACADRAFT_256528 [Phanerochaete carnosa HHB-10118-sp]|uniref:Blue (type 1) copper domain-containing protein n=1 Tax=Phanerochaete carnosa (strain HHB-10118-sp) TaxID=650164 RepID=K5UZU8_PHACS|nr:uncharacterized protein PHACADRAFT_256528 [Phanerochaete carnosa HHB-10118-sp]EKM55711.1 hypothetical protein PHACADRAFT_256528 [Phanerochaete carnosa HHB-10118-sp]